jgi:hypothetical protein
VSRARPNAAHERLERREGLLSKADLERLGLPRRAVDAVFRALPNVEFPGFSRAFVHAKDFSSYLDEHTYDGRSKVKPSRGDPRHRAVPSSGSRP